MNEAMASTMPSQNSLPQNLMMAALHKSQGDTAALMFYYQQMAEKVWGLPNGQPQDSSSSTNNSIGCRSELPNISRQGKEINELSEIQSVPHLATNATQRWQFSVVLSIIVWNADFSQKVECYPE